MSTAVICTATPAQAESIITELKAANFSNNDISVLLADKTGTRDFAVEHNTKAPEGAAAGVGTGAVLGGVLGWLAGVGSLAIPGLGPLIAAGPIMGALSGATVGGTLGGLTGALIGMGVPELEAKQYEGKVKTGSCLLSVHSENSDQTKRAKEIFERNKAQDITSTSEAGVPASSKRKA